MKKIINIILCLTLVMASCSVSYTDQSMDVDKFLVLNKKCSPGGEYAPNNYQLFLYDGEVTAWVKTTYGIYEMYDIQDTINTIVLTKVVDMGK